MKENEKCIITKKNTYFKILLDFSVVIAFVQKMKYDR